VDLPRAVASVAEEAARFVVYRQRLGALCSYRHVLAITGVDRNSGSDRDTRLALQTLSRCARVASLANIGDGPSRLKFDEAAELGFVRICADSALENALVCLEQV
jgi:hypothetical protein